MKKSPVTMWLLTALTSSALLLSGCGWFTISERTGDSVGEPEEAILENVSVDGSEEAISATIREYMAQQGGPVDQVEVEVERLDGDFARVKIISTDPDVPGGFTGFLGRQDGVWTTLIVGSAFNPVEVEALGIPESILPEGWVSVDSEAPAGEVAGAPTGPASDSCPATTDGTLLHIDEARGFCLLYPTGHIVEQLDSGNTEIVVGSIMNHTDPRVGIAVEDLAGRTIDQVVDEFLAGYEGFEIERTEVTLGGQEAVLLDGIPGQDTYRKLFAAHDGFLYQLDIFPYDPNLVDTLPQAEQLYGLVLESFRFMTP